MRVLVALLAIGCGSEGEPPTLQAELDATRTELHAARTALEAETAKTTSLGEALKAEQARSAQLSQQVAVLQRQRTVERGADAKCAALGAVEVARHDEVCRGDGVERACTDDLQCCYPCGVQGCDWVCRTPAECLTDQTRP